MQKRTGYTLLVVFLVVLALAAAVYLRVKAPPEAARLLPESDAIVFLNVKPLRAATHFDRSPVPPSASLAQFTEATGIVPERDLNEAAFALHRMADPNGPNGPVAFSEVFTGKFDGPRLTKYLASLATAQESYADHTIYALPVENRTLRVTVLDYDTVAASNAPTAEQIHSMIDRARAAASPFAGSSLLSARYGEVPRFSSAWAIGHIGLPFGRDGKVSVAGLELPVPADTTFVASLRYTSALHLRIDELTASQQTAQQTAGSLGRYLQLIKAVEQNQPVPVDPAVKELFDSIAIHPHEDRVTLTATLPPEALKRLAPSGTP